MCCSKDLCRSGAGACAPILRHKNNVLRWIAVEVGSRQTCLLRHTTDIFVVSQSRNVWCVIQQTCLLRQTPDMPAVAHSRHFCCVARCMDFPSSSHNCNAVEICFQQTRNSRVYTYAFHIVHVHIHMHFMCSLQSALCAVVRLCAVLSLWYVHSL